MATDVSIVSKHRLELMGIAILQVLLMHLFSLNGLYVPLAIIWIINLVYVQGFLFLSGFSMYYSYTRDHNIRRFYLKRVNSLLLPYILMTLPYFLYMYLTGQQDLIPHYTPSVWESNSEVMTLLGHLTTISYWYEGEFNGMWYVALTLVLYFSYPLVYQLIFKSSGGKNCNILFGYFL